LPPPESCRPPSARKPPGIGTSGSSITIASCFVAAGAPLHISAGETFLPSAVWSFGMVSFALSVVLVTVIAAGVCAETEAADSAAIASA
jgi:hypothetical protein